jgi:hypothetical protein
VDWCTLAQFLAATLLLLVTPGPVIAIVTHNTVRRGTAAGLPTVVGVGLGDACLLAATFAGLRLSSELLPAVYQWLSLAGALYLIWLAAEALRGGLANGSAVTGAPDADWLPPSISRSRSSPSLGSSRWQSDLEAVHAASVPACRRTHSRRNPVRKTASWRCATSSGVGHQAWTSALALCHSTVQSASVRRSAPLLLLWVKGGGRHISVSGRIHLRYPTSPTGAGSAGRCHQGKSREHLQGRSESRT